MTSALRLCPKCGTQIPADTRQGVCPACLLERGLGLLEEESVVGVSSSVEAAAKPGSAKADDPSRDDGVRATELSGEACMAAAIQHRNVDSHFLDSQFSAGNAAPYL